jgi:small-conductance mechanosensitive channel
VYYLLVPDYNSYMDAQQAINLQLFERFQAEGIEFAYPTQTVLAHVRTDGVPGAREPNETSGLR